MSKNGSGKRTDLNRRDREAFSGLLSRKEQGKLSSEKINKISKAVPKRIAKGLFLGEIYRRMCFHRLEGENISLRVLEEAIKKREMYEQWRAKGFPVSEIRGLWANHGLKKVAHFWAAEVYISSCWWTGLQTYDHLDALFISPGLFLRYAEYFRDLAFRYGLVESLQKDTWMPDGWKKAVKSIKIEGFDTTPDWKTDTHRIKEVDKAYKEGHIW